MPEQTHPRIDTQQERCPKGQHNGKQQTIADGWVGTGNRIGGRITDQQANHRRRQCRFYRGPISHQIDIAVFTVAERIKGAPKILENIGIVLIADSNVQTA